MKKNSKITEAYNELSRIGRGPMTPEAAGNIKTALTGSSSLLVSKAVDIAAENDMRDLAPEMIAAFVKFMEDGVETDKGCRAKTAIVKALNKFEFLGEAVFLAGARYVQLEPAFGGSEDTAIELRSGCALALARIVHPDAHFILADLLFDSAKPVRFAAVKALTYLAEPEDELMLRVKALGGDAEADVLGECFVALMTMSPARSFKFVARYLDSRDPLLIESAAIALGSSHLPEALVVLKQTWHGNSHYPHIQRSLLLPFALIRSDEAFEYLLDLVRKEPRETAADAISALRLYPGEKYVAALREVVAKRNDASVNARFAEEFGAS